jgi:hypothetical protein
MSIQRSYGRILWRNTILGFQMVNPNGDQFYIYAEPLINVFSNAGRPVRIKRRDKIINENADHHPGEIYGATEEITSNEKIYTKLILYFGAAERLIYFNADNTELQEVIDRQEFTFPKTEFTRFVKSIEAMHDQHTQFTLMMRNTDVLPPND